VEEKVRRSRPVLRLSRSPLVYTVLQVGIAPVFSLRSYLPELQEKLRKNGFPRYREGILQKLTIGQDGLAPKIESSARFEFYDKNAQTGIMVAPDAVTVHTNAYRVFEEFDETVRLAVSTLREVAGVEVVEKVGLRYVDWVRPDSTRSVDSLIQPGLRGINECELGGRDAIKLFQMFCLTAVGRMLVRFYQQRGQVLPLDLGPGPVNLSIDFRVEPNEIVSLLDLDHTSEQSFDFEMDAISELAWRLHDSLDLAFRTAVTDEALEFWGAENE
jgi:uncharacterized protein (TIGR04255 family)